MVTLNPIKAIVGVFNRQEASQPVKEAMLMHGLGAATKNDDDVAWKEQQGTNYELLHDDPLEEVLNAMMYKSAVVLNPQTNQYEVVKRAELDLNMVGLRLTTSHINRASFNDERDIEILKTKNRAMSKLIKMQMRPDTFSLGMTTFLTGVEYANEIALNDSKDGKKAKLLKTIPRVTSVEVQTGEFKQPRGRM